MRAPTPSAAVEIATPDKADILNAVRLLRQKLDKAMELKLDKAVSQIESCDKLLKELKREPEDVEKILEADIEFHKKVAEATENSLVMVVHDEIIQLTRASRKKTIEKVIEKGDKEYLEFTHKNLLEKLNGDNVNALYQAINDSYFYWKDIYK